MPHKLISNENPLGVEKIDYIEITTQDLEKYHNLYTRLGFNRLQEHFCDKHDQYYYNQNQMHIIITIGKKEGVFQYDYFKKHGDGVCTLAFRVENAEHALNEAIVRGAIKAQDLKENTLENTQFKTTAINGFGDVRNVFVERNGTTKLFAPQFSEIKNPIVQDINKTPKLIRVDHLTNNVYAGDMDKWVNFYTRIYGFIVVRYFDIKGVKTGLFSKVVCSPNREIIIPINEPDPNAGYSQIQEYLDLHKGEGVQHIAMTTEDIVESVKDMRQKDFKFLDVNSVYYEMLVERIKGIDQKENIAALQEQSILVDGDEKEYLLQIFTGNQIGPLFFEIITRRGHQGFGEGNFQALFDSIERDQIKRGVLKPN